MEHAGIDLIGIGIIIIAIALIIEFLEELFK